MSQLKQPENMEYFKCLGSMITNDARCTHEIKSTISMAYKTFNKTKTLLTSGLDLNLRKKLVNCYIWGTALYGVKNWTVPKVDQKYLERWKCCV
jgi:hypothetical protein